MKGPFGKRNFERSLMVAYYCGCECQANPGLSMNDYLEDMAFYSGEEYQKFRDLPSEHQIALKRQFRKGVENERKVQ